MYGDRGDRHLSFLRSPPLSARTPAAKAELWWRLQAQRLAAKSWRLRTVANYRSRVFGLAIRKCQKNDGTFPSITPHDLRHTAASLAISAGANVKAVQRMLGHAKASMTLDVYADLFDEDLDDVADRLDAAIRSAADPLRTQSRR